MRKMIVVLVTALSLIFGGFVFAEEKTPPTKADYVKVIPPSARMMIGGLSKSIDPKKLSASVKNTSSTAYGFTTGISEEKGSFKLGILMADLEATVRGGDREKVSKAIRSLAEGLSQLGAPLPLITAVINMGVAVNSGIDLQTINKASLPVIKPFIEDFIQKEGKMAYLRLGEWVEATRLAAEQGTTEDVANLLKGINLADYFLSELKGLPQGVTDSLKVMSELSKKKDISEKDAKTALKTVNTIIEIMG